MVINGKITAFSDENIDKKLYADLLINARLFGYPHNRWSEFAPARTETARILRAVKKPKKYEQAGFCNRQITKDFAQ